MKNYKKYLIFLLLIFLFFSSVTIIKANITVGSWSNTTKLPYLLANHPLLYGNGNLIISGGSTSFVRSDVISSLIQIGGSLSNWQNNTPHPKNIYWHSSVKHDNFIYTIGGAEYISSIVYSLSNVFKGTIDALGNISGWVEITPLPKSLAGGSAVLIGDNVYYSGGGTWGGATVPINNVVYMNTFDAEGNLGAWQIAGYLLNPTIQHVSFYSGSKLIIIGGAYNSGWAPNSNVYSAPINNDGTLGSWSVLPSLKTAVRYPMLGTTDDTVIVAGGVTTSGPATDLVYSTSIDANGNTGEWVLSSDKLPKINCCTGSTVYNNYMYITGGHTNTGGPDNYYDSTWMAPITISADPTSTPTPTPSPTSTPTPTNTPTPTATPTPTPIPQQTPIVFLPGLGGCLNFKEMFLGVPNDNGWKLTPGANLYQKLIKTFDGSALFHIFCYNWTKPVMENAQKLHDFIQNDINPPDNKVYLIGHSLGGLVARTCVQKMGNTCFVDKLITVGSPHAGSVDAYPALAGGEIWRTGPAKLGYELFIHFYQIPGETNQKTLSRIAPVLFDLLPNFKYVTKNGVDLFPNQLSYQNTLLPQLQDLSLLSSRAQTITGYGFDTVDQITLTERSTIDKLLGLWPDGRFLDKRQTQEGDSSVLLSSASFPSASIPNYSFDYNHSGIISKNMPLQKILDILNSDKIISNETVINDEEDYLVFYVHSPVTLSLDNLPLDAYVDDGMIIIPNPQNKDYSVKVKGTGNGQYILSAGQIFKDKVFWSDYFGTVKPGQEKNYLFKINSVSLKENPIIDTNGQNTTESILTLLQKLKDKINSLALSTANKKLLLSSLSKINTKKPDVSLTLLDVFRQSIAIQEKNKKIINSDAVEIRSLCSNISRHLEYLAFLKPQKTNEKEAKALIFVAEATKKQVQNKLSEKTVQIYLDGDGYLTKAKNSLSLKKYYEAKIYSLHAASLFLETKLLY